MRACKFREAKRETAACVEVGDARAREAGGAAIECNLNVGLLASLADFFGAKPTPPATPIRARVNVAISVRCAAVTCVTRGHRRPKATNRSRDGR